MTDYPILRSIILTFSQSVMGKLARTALGRKALDSDEIIVDRVRFDMDDPTDRIWLGVRRNQMMKSEHRTLRCVIDDKMYEKLMEADTTEDDPTLVAFGQRLADSFRQGNNRCLFMEEKSDG